MKKIQVLQLSAKKAYLHFPTTKKALNYHVKIASETYLLEELPHLAKQKLNTLTPQDWQYDFWKFVDEWHNKNDFIVVNTSGSTGKPKPIRLAKEKVVASARATIDFLELKKGMTALLCLPCRFIAGKMMLARTLEAKMNLIVCEPSGNPLKKIEEIIDFAAFIPLQIEKMLDDCIEKLQSVKTIIIGGVAVDAELQKGLKSFPNSVYETYGMTETITHVALKQLNSTPVGYFKALPGISFSTDKRECLVINAPHILDKKLTTNDMVHLVKRTSFEWKGRHDNVINSGGIKIHPEMVEKKLSGKIAGNFIIGSLPDKKLGQKIVLFIEGKQPANQQILWGRIKMVLNGYEIPKKIFWVNEFERTENGKVKRNIYSS